MSECQVCIHENNGRTCGYCEADNRNRLRELGLDPNQDIVDQVLTHNRNIQLKLLTWPAEGV